MLYSNMNSRNGLILIKVSAMFGTARAKVAGRDKRALFTAPYPKVLRVIKLGLNLSFFTIYILL